MSINIVSAKSGNPENTEPSVSPYTISGMRPACSAAAANCWKKTKRTASVPPRRPAAAVSGARVSPCARRASCAKNKRGCLKKTAPFYQVRLLGRSLFLLSDPACRKSVRGQAIPEVSGEISNRSRSGRSPPSDCRSSPGCPARAAGEPVLLQLLRLLPRPSARIRSWSRSRRPG